MDNLNSTSVSTLEVQKYTMPVTSTVTVVYVHKNPVTNRIFYVGIGLPSRPYEFKKSCRNIYWVRTVAKYGKPIVEIVAEYTDRSKAEAHEVMLIASLRDAGVKLTNLTAGGEKHKGMSSEQREELSQVLKAKFTDPVHRAKHLKIRREIALRPEFAEKQQRLKTEFWNDPSNEYRKQLASEKQKAYAANPEVRKAISETGRKYIEDHPEFVELLREKAIAQFADPEKRARYMAAKAKPVKAILKGESTYTIYESARAAAVAVGVSPSAICNNISGKSKTCAGVKWYFAT